jgi:two-component system, LytTR family, response regulator
MRVLVVDDEPLVRTALARLLNQRTDIEEFELAEDAHQALNALRRKPFDVLLLDIQMPEMTGLELVKDLGDRRGSTPSIIFITAHHEHAVEAFEKRAVDYVLKPFVPSRLHEALDRAVRRTSQERAEQLVIMLKDLKAPARSNRIAIKDKGRVIFVDIAEIVSVEASGNYVLLLRKAGSYMLRETIAEIAEKLKSHGFIRIHRSVLVNSAFVESIQPGVGNEYVLRTKTGKEYHVTPTFRRNLKALAEFWIGSETLGAE